MSTWAIAIHGGAENWLADKDETRLTNARSGLHRSLAAAAKILEQNGSAFDAAIAAIHVLEDDPSFNAGIGAALTEMGTVEHDAGIMRGSDGAFGAVAGVRCIRSPIEAARRVFVDGRHTLLIGTGAEKFAIERGCETADQQIFITERARISLQRKLKKNTATESKGTVGVVVRDNAGELIAATSTGGLTGKRCGRVGDSPLPGAGTWADRQCAISTTGDGELFMRTCFGFYTAQLVSGGMDPTQALMQNLARIAELGGAGGAIFMPLSGAPVWSVIKSDLARGMQCAGQTAQIAIGADEIWSQAVLR